MANSQEKVTKLSESRAKLKTGWKQRYQQQVTAAVDKAERKVRNERLANSYQKAMTKGIGEHEQL